MNEDNNKKKVKKRMSLKIASSLFPIHSRGKGEKRRHRWKKSVSVSALRQDKTGRKSGDCEKKAACSPKHAGKDKVGRLLSQRFPSFHKWRASQSEEKKSTKNDAKEEKDINVESIGLKRQISRNLRRTLVRKYKSVSDFRKSRSNSSIKHAPSTRKSYTDIRMGGPNKKFLSVHISGRDMSIQVKSRLNCTAETVDLASVARPARIQQIKQSEAAVVAVSRIENSVKAELHNKKLSYVQSPTCADPFGIDEEEHCFMFENQTIGISLENPMANGLEMEDCKDIVANSNQGRQTTDISDKEENPLQRRSISSVDLTCKEHVYDNPWILKEDEADKMDQSPQVNHSQDMQGKPNSLNNRLLTPQISISSVSGYNSFGFDVGDLNEAGSNMDGMKRSESKESVDSFGSSVHSVQSQELMFSDSEAEHDMDRISISSSDSGTFETQLLSEKSFESDITQGSNADHGSSASENREHEKGTPRVRQRRKLGISVEDVGDTAGKIARKLFGQQVSVETAIETRENFEKPNNELIKRRSLDSNLKIKQMSLELDPVSEARLKWTGSSDSGLSSALSPVFEADSKSHGNKLSDKEKYFTLPNPRKSKSNRESPKKRVSLGALSKKISEKAQSLSNIKLGSSFKLRNIDKEASKLQTFLKTNSWTNLVVKKGAEVASNFSTLMRKRSNSNTAVSSPFSPSSRKAKKNVEEDDKVLVCEKVKLYAPRKRATTSEEITKWKKRLKLNIEIAQNRDIISGIRSRANSYLGRPNSSNSLSPIYSPTLLDEIMKSVDRVRFNCYRGSVLTDLDLSDGEDSSSSSSPIVFCSKPRTESESAAVKSDFFSLCKTCGKMKNNSLDGNDLLWRRNHKLPRHKSHTQSLCDLHGICNCHTDRFLNRFKNGLSPDICSYMGSEKMLNKNLDTESVSALDIMCNKLSYNKVKRPTSMFELRNIEEVLFDIDEDEVDKPPGILLRHQPLLNLSDDNLDKDTGLTEVVGNEGTCQSCEELISQHKCSTCIRGGDISDDLLSPDSQFESETPDAYHSCSELMETETCEDGNDETDYKKSNSCGNLVDKADVFIGNKLKDVKELQDRKEVRKAKVKSLSSSHDALSTFVAIDNLEIAKDIERVVKDVEYTFGDKVRVAEGEKESSYTTKASKDTSETSESSSSYKTCESSGEKETAVVVCDSKSCDKESDKKDSCAECEDVTEKDETCVICEKLRKQGVKENDEVPKNLKLSSDNLHVKDLKPSNKGLGKPPLPQKQRGRKVLSMNDVSCQENRTTHLSEMQKRHSMNADFSKGSSSSLTTLSPTSNKTSAGRDREISCSAPSTPLLHSHRSDTFDFSENHSQANAKDTKNTLSPPRLERLKSQSSDNMNTMKRSQAQYEENWPGGLRHTCSDDVFSKPLCQSEPGSPGNRNNHGVPDTEFSEFLPSSLFPDFPGPDVETAFKYDVGLGYLLHSVECDNQLICFYSFQRNKQLMESVITPLAALPGVTGTKPLETSNVNKSQKPQNKLKYENQPNPAAPITAVPSDKLSHAGRVIRTVLLTRASHMIRDRKFHLRTYRRCMVGTEMVDWLIQQSPLVHSRTQAIGMWQALLEEGVVVHVCHEHQFKDEYLFYRFHEDDEGVSTVPTQGTKRECEEELQDMFLMLAQTGPDAMMRMILRKLPHERTMEDLEIIYEELLHIKALSHLSTMVKRELASVLVFESHAKSGTVLFNQGDEGKSWYIILKGSVNVVIYGKGVVCTLHEGDDFGKLALVNDAPRAATIVLRDDNCHFLRVDKDDFNRILRDVEANTVRLKEHGQDVLVLEKIPSNSQSADGIVHTHYKYSVMAGTPEKMLEYLLETRLDSKKEDEIDGFLEDFLLTHVIFMPNNHLCPVLLSHYHSSMADTNEQEAYEISLNHKKCVLYFVKEWANTVGCAFKADQTINAFLETEKLIQTVKTQIKLLPQEQFDQELHSCILEDLSVYSTLKEDVVAMETILQTQANSPDPKSKRKAATNFTLSRKHSKECQNDSVTKCKPIKPSDETIFKVYCADHTYSTLKLPMDTTVERLLYSTKEKLGLGDDLVLCEVKSTGERIVFKENDLCVISGLSINGRLFITPKEHLDALTPLPEQEGPQEGTFPTIEMISSREMAYYMTMYDWELFAYLQEYELIYQVFGRYKFGKITANLDLFLRRFNEIQFWVVTEMVLTTNLSKRVSLLRKFIKIASHCKEYQNLNSFFAVVMGLSNIAVSRLSQTWEKLPGKFKKLFAEFETLMDPSRNHRVYRLSVAKMVPPIIPFMPLLMKDMTFTHEGNKTYFDGLVNFEKMHMISQTLKTVRFCRSANLELEVPGSLKSSDTATYIRNLHVIDNQRLLTKLSHKVEPRKT